MQTVHAEVHKTEDYLEGIKRGKESTDEEEM